ncbi:MAG: glycosyltransferase family 2 protein [Myxococcales bacterium]|nr:glycosyltransferase family 2 protein [Myxococcales bacterium]
MISVLVPARDEASSIAAVVAAVARALSGERFEVLVIDDGSIDGTGEAARSAGAAVLRLGGLGYGASIKAGARMARGRLLVLIDGDGSYPEEAIPSLLAAVRTGARQAIGARPAINDAEGLSRIGLKAAFRAAVQLFAGVAVPDLNSGLRVLYASDLRAMEAHLPDRFSLTTTLTLGLAALGDSIAFVPISYRRRTGRSKWRVWADTWLMARAVARGIHWIRRGGLPLALPAPRAIG